MKRKNPAIILLTICVVLFPIKLCPWMDIFTSIIRSPARDIEKIIEEKQTDEFEPYPKDPANTPAVLTVLPTDSGSSTLPLKPICFLNTGTIAATVMARSYTPLNTDSPGFPSNASTVAIPGGSSSACLSLPLGTYTWCYHWELGDSNGDGMIEYAHTFTEQPVLLDESDTDDLDLAEKVSIVAPSDTNVSFGVCGMDFSPYVVSKTDAVKVTGGLINIGHDGQSVTLRGPITLLYYYIYNTEQEILAGVPREYSAPETIVIPAGETWTFTHFEGYGDHPGDWNAYLWLISIE